ncbi:MAG: hypothetical protein WDN76_03160 [Alphaproteobacteria bacterium]
MVIVAPPVAHHDQNPTRGAAGWYILVLMTIAAGVALWFAYQTWDPKDGVARQAENQAEAIRQADYLRDYQNRLITQTQQMRDFKRTPEAPTPPDLVRDIESRLIAGEKQLRDNIPVCRSNMKNCADRTKKVECPGDAEMKEKSWCREASALEQECGPANTSAICVQKTSSLYCQVNKAFCPPEVADTAAVVPGSAPADATAAAAAKGL